MGCDIHSYAEIKINGEWQVCGRIFENPYHRSDEPEHEPDGDGYIWNAKLIEHPYRCRNYEAFAMLAGVRNSRGIVPVAEPRGLPLDATKKVREEAVSWDGDGHSHSWLLLSEMERYFAEVDCVAMSGYVSEKEYQTFKSSGRPNSYCGGVYGNTICHVENIVMDALISGEVDRKEGADYYTEVKWTEPNAEAAGWLASNTIPALQAVASEHGVSSDDVRMVFFFDN